MSYDILNRLIKLRKDGKKISGRLIAKIDDDVKSHLYNMYGIDDILSIIYIIADEIDVPKCEMCDKKVTLRGAEFKKFCSVACANKFNNKIKNKETNRKKSIRCKEKYAAIIPIAAQEYVQRTTTIKEIAKEFNIPVHQFRNYLIEYDLIKKNNHTTYLMLNWKEKNPNLTANTLENLINIGETAKSAANILNIATNTVAVYAKKYGLKWKQRSTYEKKLFDFFKKLNINFIQNSRKIIPPLELDFFLPDHNIAIEVNGNYWHSDLHKNKNYHLTKHLLCESKGIRLLQFFEHELENRYDNVTSMILAALKMITNRIYARNTVLKCISKADAKMFLEKNHIFGHANATLNIGLFHDNELVAISTFRTPRFAKKYDYELIRFCNKKDTIVIGGFSKILSTNILVDKKIVSYAHRRLFKGDVYLNAGFKLSHISAPGYFWYLKKTNLILSRYQTQKAKLNTNKTENEFMRENGFLKIHDCGQLVFTLNC